MRIYDYYVGDKTDFYGDECYPVLCRSWDDFDDAAESWVRVVNWYKNKSTAQTEVDAFNANAKEARQSANA